MSAPNRDTLWLTLMIVVVALGAVMMADGKWFGVFQIVLGAISAAFRIRLMVGKGKFNGPY